MRIAIQAVGGGRFKRMTTFFLLSKKIVNFQDSTVILNSVVTLWEKMDFLMAPFYLGKLVQTMACVFNPPNDVTGKVSLYLMLRCDANLDYIHDLTLVSDTNPYYRDLTSNLFAQNMYISEQ